MDVEEQVSLCWEEAACQAGNSRGQALSCSFGMVPAKGGYFPNTRRKPAILAVFGNVSACSIHVLALCESVLLFRLRLPIAHCHMLVLILLRL